MIVARVVGFVLLLIGIAAGLAVVLEPLQFMTIQSAPAIWGLFALAFLGGTVLLTLGAPQRRVGATLALEGTILLLFALAAAALILLGNVGGTRIAATDSSWFIFLACVPAGLIALIAGVFLTRTPAHQV
jgi:hypothetical protein